MSTIPLREEEVEVEYNGEKYRIKIRELTAREYLDIQNKSIKSIYQDGTMDIDQSRFMIELVSKSIVEAPFGNDVKTIESLPFNLFKKILARVIELNPLSF